MSRSAPQLNIRSAFARERAAALARRTGLTTTQVVEQALRAWTPPAEADDLPPAPPGLVRKGWLLVKPAAPDAPPISQDQTQALIDDAREERADAVWTPA